MLYIYIFSLNITEQDYICRFNNAEAFRDCPIKEICTMRSQNLETFEFKPNTTKTEYFENWFVMHDLMCKSKSSYEGAVNYFFIGYVFGIIFLQLPHQYGRKSVLIVFLAFSILGTALMVFG